MGSKRGWTRGEKWLFGTPLLLGAALLATYAFPRAWRSKTGKPEQLPVKSPYTLASFSLSEDGRYLSGGLYVNSANVPNEISFWDAKTLKPLPPLTRPTVLPRTQGKISDLYTPCVRFSPNSEFLAWSGLGHKLNLLDYQTRKPLWNLDAAYYDVGFSPDSQRVAVHTYKQVQIRQARTGKKVAAWNLTPSSGDIAVSFSPCGKWFASTGARPGWEELEHAPNSSSKIEVRRTTDWKLVRTLPITGTQHIGFSPDGKSVIGVSHYYGGKYGADTQSTRLVCFDVESGSIQWEADCAKPETKTKYGYMTDATFSPQGDVVAVANQNKVLLVNASTGNIEQILQIPPDQQGGTFFPSSMAFMPDGKRLFKRAKSAILYWDL